MELSTDAKWAVYIALTFDEEKYFNELKEMFGANPSQMDRILKSLVDGGLIAKKVKTLDEIGDRRKIYYRSTSYGKKLLYALCDVVLPPESLMHYYRYTLSEDNSTCISSTDVAERIGVYNPWKQVVSTPPQRDISDMRPTITNAALPEIWE
ncbi:hypothetical protein ASZ90_010832 [hydrocarbon metagenome]|uniref:HTH hxlR-type domain-containing protein n=1 Tax=hydrocarbon metagenome TaxID=938273 RepID=A0A0W8FEX0_9ZZZZ